MSSFKFIKSKKQKTLISSKDNKESIDFSKKDANNLAEFHETLYSDQQEGIQSSSDRLFLRDIPGIEKNIDTLHKPHSSSVEGDLEKKVDKILSTKPIVEMKRKQSNVIYVVSKPQPGQVKGDWAVRSHGKIFSHHRTKHAAIQKARDIAKKRDATVMVQNTDGTFSEGFKPRK